LPEHISNIEYIFGANHLYIGSGLLDTLKFLEKRYGLDFNNLEEDYLNKNKQ
jgi:hypothetical protein